MTSVTQIMGCLFNFSVGRPRALPFAPSHFDNLDRISFDNSDQTPSLAVHDDDLLTPLVVCHIRALLLVVHLGLTSFLFIYSHASRTLTAIAHHCHARRQRYPPSLYHPQSLISNSHTFPASLFPIVAISAVTVSCCLPRSSSSPS